MSLSQQPTRKESINDFQSAAPDLALTGNIISATFLTPHSVRYHKDGTWETGVRRGQSALFDSFAYLSSDESPWKHTVVAWTGEIDRPLDQLVPDAAPSSTANIRGATHLSAPIPVPGNAPPTPPAVDGLFIPSEHKHTLESQLAHDRQVKTVPVWLCDDEDNRDDGVLLKDQERWRRYAEHELYTLLHYKQHEPSNGNSERVEWADYYRANLKFAEKIIETYKPGDIVIVHDYYLMLVPSMLRQRAPNMYIAFFLHCPFPSSEFLRCLPRRKEVLEGVLGSNLVGFQSYSYSRHFSSCCTRILQFPSDSLGIDAYGVRVEVGVFPIGIDAAKVEETAFSKEVTEKYMALRKMYEGKKIIVGRDRLGSVRGVVQKLMAYERFLELYPEWRDNVVLVQVTSPTTISEEKDDAESKIASKVNQLVMRINGTHGNLEFSPVQHFPQYLQRDEYFALLRAADIGLITSVRDGMNTTSLEYVVCQRDTHGPLILSEFSGTAGSLQDAIHINPWDLTDVAKQIDNALSMSDEMRLTMQQSLYGHVVKHNVQNWISKFIRKLVGTLASTSKNMITPLLDTTKLLQQYRAASRRLFMFDYDGTLTPIVREPSAAIPTERLIQTLKSLAADPQNAVWVISGRDQEFLEQHLGHISEIGFSAEHGSFIRQPGEKTWANLAEQFDMGWQAEVMEVFQKWTDRVNGSFIERKRCALTWHYRQADQEQALHAAQQSHKELLAGVAKRWEVEVMEGKANLEVRPTFINKGEIAKRLVNEMQGSSDKDGQLEFVYCLGDDFTDEDMFRALNTVSGKLLKDEHIFTSTVGPSSKVTLAKYHLLEPKDVINSVALLTGVGQSGLPEEKVAAVNLAATAAVEGKLPDE
ncbi:family 20 glycosyltransferase [Microdochium bolleyi]|uniref:Family 20 glycosyltransferase n=1 Tax=Microdochium bolleyi TaxID=196109 RepID=A0A136IYX3_9PEZI|nr:family 20 glycosyltransferase [Microdochium bolleyi]